MRCDTVGHGGPPLVPGGPDPGPGREQAIALILERGFVARPSAWRKAREILQRLGLRFIFWDLAHTLVFTGVTALAMILTALWTPTAWQHTVTVAASPTLFFVIILGSETVDRASNLYDLKRTCHVTTRQITALRVMCHSALGGIAAVVLALVSAEGWGEILRLLPLSLAVLFSCAALEVSALRWVRSWWGTPVLVLAWVGVNLSLALRYGRVWEDFLAGLSNALTAIIALASLGILIWQLSHMLTETRRYAFA